MKPKFSKKFEELIDFINFTHEFREVVRIARTPNNSRMENDAEHVCQIAQVAWFLIDQENLKLNKEKVFIYALAHDLVEVYAGDIPMFDKRGLKTKHDREKKALERIKKRFPKFKNLSKVIEQYERRGDKESKFIYALDKLIPPIQCYLEDGKIWHENDIAFGYLSENKSSKIKVSKEMDKYWQELLKELTKNKTKYFPK